jgi:hypothetical protein
MALVQTTQVVIDVDEHRHITVSRTRNGTVVLMVEDPQDVAVTELRVANVRELIEALRGAIGE